MKYNYRHWKGITNLVKKRKMKKTEKCGRLILFLRRGSVPIMSILMDFIAANSLTGVHSIRSPRGEFVTVFSLLHRRNIETFLKQRLDQICTNIQLNFL